jgi:hypothetical protein
MELITNRFDSRGLKLEKIGMKISQGSYSNLNPIFVVFWLGILAVFAPASITLMVNDTVTLVNLGSPFWSLSAEKFEWFPLSTKLSSDLAFFVLIIFYLPFLILRVAFGIQIMKYYQQITTKSRVLLVGVMSSFYELAATVSTVRGPYLGYLVVPLPILFIFGTLLLWMIEEPLIKPPPLRKEPVIIFGAVLVFHLSNIFTIDGGGYFVLLLIVILILSEYRSN